MDRSVSQLLLTLGTPRPGQYRDDMASRLGKMTKEDEENGDEYKKEEEGEEEEEEEEEEEKEEDEEEEEGRRVFLSEVVNFISVLNSFHFVFHFSFQHHFNVLSAFLQRIFISTSCQSIIHFFSICLSFESFICVFTFCLSCVFHSSFICLSFVFHFFLLFTGFDDESVSVRVFFSSRFWIFFLSSSSFSRIIGISARERQEFRV